jgi:hypothetical protein
MDAQQAALLAAHFTVVRYDRGGAPGPRRRRRAVGPQAKAAYKARLMSSGRNSMRRSAATTWSGERGWDGDLGHGGDELSCPRSRWGGGPTPTLASGRAGIAGRVQVSSRRSASRSAGRPVRPGQDRLVGRLRRLGSTGRVGAVW